MDKEQIRNGEDKALEATKNTDWPAWVKHLIWFIIGGISAVLCMTQTGCTYTSSQVGADGSTANRAFSLDAGALDFARMYGVPTVTLGK